MSRTAPTADDAGWRDDQTGRFDQPPPPGWLPDPDGEGERFWNGHGWTAKRRAAAPSPRRLAGGWVCWSRPALATIAVLLLVTVALVVAALTAIWPG